MKNSNLPMKRGLSGRQTYCAAVLMALACLHPARAEESWQVWLDQSASKDLTEKSTVRAAQSFRYDCDEGRLATYYLEAGYARHLRSWLDGGLGYRQQYDQRDGHWIEENRPFVELTPRWKTRLATLSDRNRLEYRVRAGQEDVWRYRNKLTLQWNAWAAFGLKPYVAAEAFADESAKLKERNRTRFTLGLRTDPDRFLLRRVRARWAETLAMDYYVIVQRTKNNDQWADEYIAGLQLGVHF
ncbi:MAG: DUF2490 domain-containing protein [Kiritimatiellia bacterium]